MPDFDVTKALRILQRHNFEGVDEEIVESFISDAENYLKGLRLKKAEKVEYKKKRLIQPGLNVIDQWIGKGIGNRANSENKVLCIKNAAAFISTLQELCDNYRNEVVLLADCGQYMTAPGEPLISILSGIRERIRLDQLSPNLRNLDNLIRDASLRTFDPAGREVDIETYAYDVIGQAQAQLRLSQNLCDVLADIANESNVDLFTLVMSGAKFSPGLLGIIVKRILPLFKSPHFAFIIEGSQDLIPEPLRSRVPHSWSL